MLGMWQWATTPRPKNGPGAIGPDGPTRCGAITMTGFRRWIADVYAPARPEVEG